MALPLSLGGPQQQAPSTAKRSRLLMSALAGVALVVLLFASRGGGTTGAATADKSVVVAAAADGAAKPPRVPVTLFVMILCPDAQFCETFLEPVLTPLKSVISVRTEYIMREEEEEEQQAGGGGSKNKKLVCMHGERECVGNKQQLCLQKRLDQRIGAGKLSADATVDVLLKFLTCGWRSPADIGTDKGARQCLAAIGWAAAADADDVLACASGAEGDALLAASHAATTAAGAKNSCTVFVDGRRRCVRDGGAFRDCEPGRTPADFKKSICAALPKGAAGAAAVCG